MTRQTLIDYCLTFPAAYEDYPFDDIIDPGAWTVMRHKTNKKSFALIYERSGKLCANLKCDPMDADFLRQTFKGVTPAYHMNKEHWNTIIVGSDVPEEEIKRQIGNSYDLIKPKVRKNSMSKYEPLWKHLQADGRDSFKLTYDEIKAILGFDIDHSFLNTKKEAMGFGYAVGKISMKEKTVIFSKL